MADERPDPAPTITTSLVVNGDAVELAVAARVSLLEALRDHLGLTGTKEVCDMGNCGACTVLVDDDPVYSCLVLAVEIPAAAVTTVEGLTDGHEPGPVQRAFVDHDALQCGFCTPGQVMAVEALRRSGTHDESDLRSALSGNLCRCGAYRNILAAAVDACSAPEAP